MLWNIGGGLMRGNQKTGKNIKKHPRWETTNGKLKALMSHAPDLQQTFLAMKLLGLRLANRNNKSNVKC